MSIPKRISIKVLPRSSRNEIIPLSDGSFKVKLTTPPVDGKANEKLIDLLSQEWKLPKSALEIVSGKTGKNKIVEIKG